MWAVEEVVVAIMWLLFCYVWQCIHLIKLRSHLLMSFLWDFISLSFSLSFFFCQWPYCYIEPLQMALAQIASASFHPSHSEALWSCAAGAQASMPGSSGHDSIHSASLHYCHMAGSWVAVVWISERESEPRPRVINGFHCWRPAPQGSAWHRTPPHKSLSITCQQRGKGSAWKQGSQAEMKCLWCMADTPCLQVAVSLLQFSQLPQDQMQVRWEGKYYTGGKV